MAEVAKLLVAAENPMIVAGRVGAHAEGMKLMVELAETLQAPVQGGGTQHAQPASAELAAAQSGNADVILGLQVDDLWGTLNNFRDQQERSYRSIVRPATKLLSISSNDLYMKSNYQDFQRFAEVDIAIAADGEATLPSLIEACKRLITADRRRVFDERGKKIAAANAQSLERARTEATLRLGRQPDQHHAHVGGDVGRGQEQGLGARRRRRLAALEHRQVLSDDSAAAERRPSAPRCRRPSARRWRTGNTAGCASACRTTAT